MRQDNSDGTNTLSACWAEQRQLSGVSTIDTITGVIVDAQAVDINKDGKLDLWSTGRGARSAPRPAPSTCTPGSGNGTFTKSPAP